MAVSEENAAGGRVVTAPTNGAAGIIPSVLHYYRRFMSSGSQQGIHAFLLTAAAIASAKAVNAARLAIRSDGGHNISLDAVIRTMWETGADMKAKYKETARGGLAVNIKRC